ncbi:hypothetical protein HOF92_07140, partial [bacterium]|nr:hypothetical protein [bacterium]
IAQDAAIQRKGRTGRTSAGTCYRLWHQKACLEERTLPEILRSELSDLLLRGNQIGVQAAELHYLDPPETYQWEEAQKKLRYLGLLNSPSALVREFTVSPDLLAIICVCKKRVPKCLNYLLFFIALVESSVSKSPLASLKTDEKGVALDWELWKMTEGDLAHKLGVEFGSWKKTYQSLRNSFGSDSEPGTFSREDRRELFQVLGEFFPRSLFYPTKNNLWRNDFSRECLMPDSVDSQYFDAVFVLNLFEIQDQRRRRNVIAEVFLCLEKKGGFQFPSTRREGQALRIHDDRAYLRYKHYFGGLFLREEEEFLHGEEFIEVFSDPGLLEPLFPGMEKSLYYWCLLSQEKKEAFQSKEYLSSRLRQAGVTCYEDLVMLLLEDFFPGEFFQEYSRLQKIYPYELEEPGGKYAMRYDLKKKEVTFIQERGRKEPSKLLRSRFTSWKCLWSSKGRCVSI